MKTISRFLTLLLVMAVMLGAMTLTVGAVELSEEDASAYLDDYASNVASDPEFDDNIDAAIAVVRNSVGCYATILSLLPPIIAIVLALLTKEVYSSLFVGILSGALIYSNGNVWGMVLNTFDTMIGKICDSWNVGILIFLVFLGIMVSLVNKAGGSAAYGRLAASFRARWLVMPRAATCLVRTLGKPPYQDQGGRADLHQYSGYPDFYRRLFQLPDGGVRYAACHR